MKFLIDNFSKNIKNVFDSDFNKITIKRILSTFNGVST